MKTILLFILFLSFSSAGNSQWIQVYSNSPAQSCYAVRFFDTKTGYHTGVLYNSSTFNIYKTTNGGINWSPQNSQYTAQRFMAFEILHPDTVYICGNYGKILRTYNGGQNWNTLYSDTNLQVWALDFVNSFTGYAAGSFGTILKTTNRGDNWSLLNTGISNAFQGIYFMNENTGFVSGSIIVLKTTNGGNSWSNLNTPNISFETNTDVYFSNSLTGFFSTNAGRIGRTSDGGANWTIVRDQSGDAVWRLSFTDSLTGYGCTSGGNAVKTLNGGLNWYNQSTPLSENLYGIHFPAKDTGFICSWSGKILKTVNGGGGSVFINSGSVSLNDFKLYQNFPNPFNPVTTISYQLPYKANVSLKVYNVAGKEVALLVNENKSPGFYEFSFDGSGLSSGIYYYELIAGTVNETKMMLLLK